MVLVMVDVRFGPFGFAALTFVICRVSPSFSPASITFAS
jgi:hypothetical protein